jgi:hypothetical protein
VKECAAVRSRRLRLGLAALSLPVAVTLASCDPPGGVGVTAPTPSPTVTASAPALPTPRLWTLTTTVKVGQSVTFYASGAAPQKPAPGVIYEWWESEVGVYGSATPLNYTLWPSYTITFTRAGRFTVWSHFADSGGPNRLTNKIQITVIGPAATSAP